MEIEIVQVGGYSLPVPKAKLKELSNTEDLLKFYRELAEAMVAVWDLLEGENQDEQLVLFDMLVNLFIVAGVGEGIKA